MSADEEVIDRDALIRFFETVSGGLAIGAVGAGLSDLDCIPFLCPARVLQHNPEKVLNVDAIITAYSGKAQELHAALEEKYGATVDEADAIVRAAADRAHISSQPIGAGILESMLDNASAADATAVVTAEIKNAKSKGEKIVALTLEGGGVKGIVYGGAIKVLEDEGVLKDIKMFAGASAGSSGAAFLSMGFTAAELKTATVETPWKKMMDGSTNQLVNLNRLFAKFGYYKGDALENHLNNLFEKKTGKKDITFKQVFDLTGNWLKIPITNLSDRCVQWLDYKSHPNLKVAHACRISSSLPLFYQAQEFEGDWCVDGGLLNNLPARAFKPQIQEGQCCLALNLQSNAERDKFPPPKLKISKSRCACCPCSCCHSDLGGLVKLLMGTMFMNAQKNDNEDLPEWCHLVNIPTDDIGADAFDLSDKQRDQLTENGRVALREYFDAHKLESKA
jgi:NTE family protein